jgi:hypothetical protein
MLAARHGKNVQALCPSHPVAQVMYADALLARQNRQLRVFPHTRVKIRDGSTRIILPVMLIQRREC